MTERIIMTTDPYFTEFYELTEEDVPELLEILKQMELEKERLR